jgi:hypothetical protein
MSQRMPTAIWLALGLAFAVPVSAYATDGMSPVVYHRTLWAKRSALRAQIDPPAQVDPPTYSTSHGRLPPTSYPTFTRSRGQCNVSFCVGI